MAAKRSPSRQKLIRAALELFASQGITETTTRQIAERAGVNEVTLFRQFGNKHGLLLSAIEEAEVFSTLAHTLAQEASQVNSLEQALRDYVDARLQALEAMPEFVRSLVGEAGQYPTENRQSLGRELTQANRFVAQYLLTAMKQGSLKTRVPAEKFASLLNSLLLGYAVLEFTSEFHQLWDDREDFLDYVVSLFLNGAVHRISEGTARPEVRRPEPLTPPINAQLSAQSLGDVVQPTDQLRAHLPPELALDLPPLVQGGSPAHPVAMPQVSATDLSIPGASLPQPETSPPKDVADFPATIVHEILKQSKALGPQEFALAYVLFGAGLSASEITQLQRSHYQSSAKQHYLQIPQDASRLVPLNQWILGKRYGSANKNPLSQWLKGRKDNHPAVFIHVSSTDTPVDLSLASTRAVDTKTQTANSGKNSRKKGGAVAVDIRPMTLADIQDCWEQCTTDVAALGQHLPLAQARQTWCIDMLMRGIAPENLSLLTGIELEALTPYIRRTQVKRALEQARELDRKGSDRDSAEPAE